MLTVLANNGASSSSSVIRTRPGIHERHGAAPHCYLTRLGVKQALGVRTLNPHSTLNFGTVR